PPLFAQLLPQHLLANESDLSKSPFLRKPVGTGPYMVEEWVAGDHVTLVRNPNYREAGKPYLDKIIEKFVPSREVGVAQFDAGAVDILWNLTEAQTKDYRGKEGVDLYMASQGWVERLFFNLSPSSGEQAGDPNRPHPILGDIRVRQAIAY